MNFSNTSGLFPVNGKLWLASASSGALYYVPWNGSNVTGKAVQVNAAGTGWGGRAVFVSP